MIYKAKNIANYFWLVVPLLVIIDFIIIGADGKTEKTILLSTFIGSGIGILFAWLGNKDAAVVLTKDELILTRTATDSTTIKKGDINSYEVSKEGGKTKISVSLKDKSTSSVSSFALRLDDFETVMKEWISGVEMKELTEEEIGAGSFDKAKFTAQATDLVGKASDKFQDIVAGKSEGDILNEKLTSLSELKEKGIINDEEYQEKKSEILKNFS